MPIRIQIAASVRALVPFGTSRRLGRVLHRASASAGHGPKTRDSLGVRIVSDDEIAGLRLQHLGLEGPTDVLSFAPAGGVEFDGGGPAPLGDLVLSWPAVRRQTPGPLAADLVRTAADLLLHGLAHLEGHDHRTRAGARAMHRLERRLARAARVRLGPRPYQSGGM